MNAKAKLVNLCPVFVSEDIKKTVKFYVEEMGFKYAKHYDKIENFVTIYRDEIEFVIVQARFGKVGSNKRRLILTNQLQEKFPDIIKVRGDKTGMHLQVEFLNEKYSNLDWEKAVEYGVRVESFEEYSFIKGKNNNKIVLGYGNLNLDEIKTGIERLADFIYSYEE
jgi:catechol 2,3-dioxygenase-like lactoylglutathione lyase family enzyme